jgi:hypothetical protein
VESPVLCPTICPPKNICLDKSIHIGLTLWIVLTNIPQRYDGVFLIIRECCEAIMHDAAHIIRMGDKALVPEEDIKKEEER